MAERWTDVRHPRSQKLTLKQSLGTEIHHLIEISN